LLARIQFLFTYHKRNDICVIEIAEDAKISRLPRTSGKIFLPPLHYSLGWSTQRANMNLCTRVAT